MNRILATFVLILVTFTARAQKDRYRFAQTYFGIQTDLIGGSHSPEFMSGRLLIGGTHFWQKADFYISFPLFTTGISGDAYHYSEGVITGFRYLPFGISRKGPRPFGGIQWITPELSIGDGPLIERSRFGIEGGFNIVLGNFYTLELAAHHLFDNGLSYPISREGTDQILPPEIGFSLAVKKYIDTTAGLSSEKSKAFVNKRFKEFTEQKKLSTWNVAIGLSANVALSDLPMLEPYGFMPNKPPLSVFSDVGIGYYFHQVDAAVRASWRPVKQSNEAYGLNYEIRQHRLSLEAFKFLFDYHGFVPFVGLAVGSDYLNGSLSDGDLPEMEDNYSGVSYGIVFGWDIRPTDVETWLLRTNLRYLFQDDATAQSLRASGQNLEINFIQLVIYPSRWN